MVSSSECIQSLISIILARCWERQLHNRDLRNDSDQSNQTIVKLFQESCDLIGLASPLWRWHSQQRVSIIFDIIENMCKLENSKKYFYNWPKIDSTFLLFMQFNITGKIDAKDIFTIFDIAKFIYNLSYCLNKNIKGIIYQTNMILLNRNLIL